MDQILEDIVKLAPDVTLTTAKWRVCWSDKSKKHGGHGNPVAAEDALAGVAEGKKVHPYLKHWMIMA